MESLWCANVEPILVSDGFVGKGFVVEPKDPETMLAQSQGIRSRANDSSHLPISTRKK